jgi:hypothetical protein
MCSKKTILFALLFLSSFFYSSFSSADTYNAIYKYKCPFSNASYTVNGPGFTTSYTLNSIDECLTIWNNNRVSSLITAGTTFRVQNLVFTYLYFTNGTYGSTNLYTQSYQSTCPGGGTVSGTYPSQICSGATSCTSPQVRDPATGLCGADTSCPTGTQIQLGVLQADPPASGSGELTININGDSSTTQKTVMDGKQYQYSLENFAGSCYTKSDGVYCNYNATSTGVCNVTANNNTGITPSSGTSITNSNSGSCLTDSKNNTLCKSNPQSNKTCGTVNGSTVCVDTTSGTGTVNGLPYQTSDKNCGFYNGNPVCVSSPGSGSATEQGCLRNGGVVACVNSDIKTTSTVTHTTDLNNNTVTTTTTHDNIIGDVDNVATETCTPSGDCSTVVTSHPTQTGSTAANSTNCPGCATETTLSSLKGSVDALKGTGDSIKGALDSLVSGTGRSPASVTQGAFDDSVPSQAVSDASAAYSAKFDEVKSAMTAMISNLDTGGASLPNISYGTIKGVEVSADLNKWASELSVVGGAVMVAAAFISLVIILG